MVDIKEAAGVAFVGIGAGVIFATILNALTPTSNSPAPKTTDDLPPSEALGFRKTRFASRGGQDSSVESFLKQDETVPGFAIEQDSSVGSFLKQDETVPNFAGAKEHIDSSKQDPINELTLRTSGNEAATHNAGGRSRFLDNPVDDLEEFDRSIDATLEHDLFS